MAQPARERLLGAAATAEGSLRRHDGAAYGAARPGAAGEPGLAGRGRRSRARRPGNGAWPPYGANDDFYSASPPLVAGSVADSDLLRRQQQVNREAGDLPAAGHRRHGLGVPRLAEGRAAWPGRGHLSASRSCSAAAPSCRLTSNTSPAGRIAGHARRADRSSCRAPQSCCASCSDR